MPLCRYVEAEKTNGRWAMMAVVGESGQELEKVVPSMDACTHDHGMYSSWNQQRSRKYAIS